MLIHNVVSIVKMLVFPMMVHGPVLWRERKIERERDCMQASSAMIDSNRTCTSCTSCTWVSAISLRIHSRHQWVIFEYIFFVQTIRWKLEFWGGPTSVLEVCVCGRMRDSKWHADINESNGNWPVLLNANKGAAITENHSMCRSIHICPRPTHHRDNG